MGVRLENFGNFDAKLIRFGQPSVGRLHRRIAIAVIEVEDRIDDRALFGCGVPHQVAHRIRRFVKKARISGLGIAAMMHALFCFR